MSELEEFYIILYNNKDPCDTNTCGGNGTCNRTTGLCICNVPYTGDQCQTSKCFFNSLKYFVYNFK